MISKEERDFFSGKPHALELYEAFRAHVLEIDPEVEIKTKKTQIGFYSPQLFACVSFLPVRKAALRPSQFITVTFSLPYRSPWEYIDAAVEIRQGRWTHHVLVSGIEDLSDDLFSRIAESADFCCH